MSLVTMKEIFQSFSLRLTFGVALFFAAIASPVSTQTIDTTSSWDGVSSFEGASDAPFITTGLSKSPWLARVGLELVHHTKNGPEISARYDGDFRHGYINNSASIKLGWTF